MMGLDQLHREDSPAGSVAPSARRPAVVIHPLLFAAFPVLFLFAHNQDQGLSLGNLAGPLAIAVAGVGVVFALLSLVLRSAARAGLVVSALVLLFFSYGYVYLGLHGVRVAGVEIGRHLFLLPALGILAAVAVVALARARGSFPGLTQGFNVVAAGLVLLNAVNIAWFQYRSAGPADAALRGGDVRLSALGTSGTQGRDVYYIMLEEYGGRAGLLSQFGFDETPFLEALEARGFSVARRTSTNYPHTILSLASSLNMRYLGDPPVGRSDLDEPALVSLVQDSEVVRALRAAGYRYIHLGSWWTPTATSPIADENLRIGGPSEFTSILEQTTALAPLATDGFRLRQWKRVRFQFDTLMGLSASAGPRFVFAHITIPHAPYVFDAAGRYQSRAAVERLGTLHLYLEQLEYTNAAVLRMLDRLLSRPQDERPIIVLQSDEGPYEGQSAGWGSYTPATLQRKFGILNAYYLPGPPAKPAPYPTITPVNSFRMIFDRYFRQRLPLLPDRNFAFRDDGGDYAFADVTDLVRPLL